MIAIFAGGKSTRMGRDKAQLVWHGAPLLQRICATALSVTDRVLVVGRERPLDWPLENVEFVRDEVADLGPLGGLQTALEYARREHVAQVFALACDLPLITETDLRWLLQSAQRPLFHGLISLRDGESEPLFSVYTPLCLSLIHHQVAQQKRSLRGLIQCGDFEFAELPSGIAAHLHNVNTTEDWAQAKALAQRFFSIGATVDD